MTATNLIPSARRLTAILEKGDPYSVQSILDNVFRGIAIPNPDINFDEEVKPTALGRLGHIDLLKSLYKGKFLKLSEDKTTFITDPYIMQDYFEYYYKVKNDFDSLPYDRCSGIANYALLDGEVDCLVEQAALYIRDYEGLTFDYRTDWYDLMEPLQWAHEDRDDLQMAMRCMLVLCGDYDSYCDLPLAGDDNEELTAFVLAKARDPQNPSFLIEAEIIPYFEDYETHLAQAVNTVKLKLQRRSKLPQIKAIPNMHYASLVISGNEILHLDVKKRICIRKKK